MGPPAVTWARMRTFLAVADHGSVRAAAASLHVTEPAVSTAIGQISQQLGIELVARSGRGIRLTDAGEVYTDYCRSILGLVDEAHTAVRQAGRGQLRIGAVATASEYVLPPLLASFHRRYPAVDLSLSVLPRDDLFTRLRHHETDLAIAGRVPGRSGLVSRAGRPNTLIVVGAPEAGTDPLTATWLLRGRGSGTRETTLGLLGELDAHPPTLTLGTLGAVVAAAREGLGVTLVHADAVGHELESGSLRRIAVPRTPLTRPWHIATTGTPTPTTALFLRHVTDAGEVGDGAFHLYDRPAG